MTPKQIRDAFEGHYKQAADRNKVFVHFERNSAGQYSVIGVRLAFEAYQGAVAMLSTVEAVAHQNDIQFLSENEVEKSLRTKFEAEYNSMCRWRDRWTRLSSDVERGRARGLRLQSTQDRIERRARLANRRIGSLIAKMDEERARLRATSSLTSITL